MIGADNNRDRVRLLTTRCSNTVQLPLHSTGTKGRLTNPTTHDNLRVCVAGEGGKVVLYGTHAASALGLGVPSNQVGEEGRVFLSAHAR